MQERLKSDGVKGVLASTMHSLSVRMLMRKGEDFSIYDQDDCNSIIKRLAKQHKITDKDEFYEIGDEIALLKDNQITAVQCSSKYRAIYLDYEKELYDNRALDFADLITRLVGESTTGSVPWDHILVDEAQDLSNGQIVVVRNMYERLSRREGTTVTLVGDIDQCQPEETNIITDKGIKTLKQLSEFDTLPSFDRHSSHIFKNKKIIKQTRKYTGLLYKIKCDNLESESTPNHKWPVRYIKNENNKEIYCTYIMRQGDRFRIGQCLIYGRRSAGFGFSVRCRVEKADEAWILSTHYTLKESLIQEEILSYQFGIPQTCFQGHNPGYNQEVIDAIFRGLNPIILRQQVKKCLIQHKRDINYPFWTKTTWTKYGYRTSHECYTCNILPDIASIPVKINDKIEWRIINSITTRPVVDINVVSLDVEKYHTYVLANGMITCNSVYEWRNAKPILIKNFVEKNAEIIPLGTNFRSTRNIVDFSRKLIGNNRNRVDKPLVANSKEYGQTPKIQWFYDSLEEADYIANLCSKSKDICVLYRSNWMSMQLEVALKTRNISYTVSDTIRFIDRKEVKDVLAYIRVACNSQDKQSLTRAIQTPKRGFGKKAMEDVTRFEDIIDEPKLSDFVSRVFELRERAGDAGIGIQLLLLRTNYLGHDERDKKANLDQLVTILKGKTLQEAMFDLTGGTPTEDGDNTNRVHLMTLHSSKGTEYEKVIIMGCEEGITPHINSDNQEEERRLFYVGMTRPEQELIFTYAGKRLMFGSYVYQKPTRYFKELGLKI